MAGSRQKSRETDTAEQAHTCALEQFLKGLQQLRQLLPERYCLVSQAPIDLNRIFECQILNPSWTPA